MKQSRRDFLRTVGITGAGTLGALHLGLWNKVAHASAFGLSNGLVNSLSLGDQSIILLDAKDKYSIRALGIPSHPTGQFPNDNCPGSIVGSAVTYQITKTPKKAKVITALNGWLFGVAVNGVCMDPTGPSYYKNGVESPFRFEVLSALGKPALGIDFSNAHVQRSGEYHYHGLPIALLSALQIARAKANVKSGMVLLGFAADGFPIYAPQVHEDPHNLNSPLIEISSSFHLKTGERPKTDLSPGGHYETNGGTFVEDWEYRPSNNPGALDECNGREGVTPEFPAGTYYYVLTNDFPFIPRFYRGTPDASFAHGLPTEDALPEKLKKATFA